MNLIKQRLLYSGKVKFMYETDNPEFLIAEFRNDTTAFDGGKH
ncbi:phosphoribosylaminoimidazolesuccinocarboxamide synthase [Coxiella-like endosymbiont]